MSATSLDGGTVVAATVVTVGPGVVAVVVAVGGAEGNRLLLLLLFWFPVVNCEPAAEAPSVAVGLGEAASGRLEVGAI